MDDNVNEEVKIREMGSSQEEKESLMKKRQKSFKEKFMKDLNRQCLEKIQLKKRYIYIIIVLLIYLVVTVWFMNQIKKPNDTSNKKKQKKPIINNDLSKIISEINKSYSSYLGDKNQNSNNLTQSNDIRNNDLNNNRNNINNLISNTNLSFNVSYINYYFSYGFNVAEVEYNINFYDKNGNLIKPSDLALYYDLHLVCHMSNINNNILVNSLPNINKNIDFNCKQYFPINEKNNFGFIIYKQFLDIIENNTIYLFTDDIIDYNSLKFNNDSKYNPEINKEENINLKNRIFSNNTDTKENNLMLKSLYVNKTKLDSLQSISNEDNYWLFKNIYNNYHCLCKGEVCSIEHINNKCKYYFYLYIIDNNRYIYNKTDYLLVDFYQSDESVDDAFPIFKELIKLNLSAHYMTESEEIYDEFCGNDTHCSKIIPIDKYSSNIDGNFLEKYLDIILRLKAVISASEFYSLENIFYNIEYLTYIMVGHGVSFFKTYLYKNYLSYNRYNKITAPPSKKIISVAKQYGWKEEDIIKVGRPKWDLYDEYGKNNKNKTEKSIFLMFTWRFIKKGKKIAGDYLNKTIQLLKNKKLNNALKRNNIILYFTFHHMLYNNIRVKKLTVPNLKLIHKSEISEYLIKSDLLITDFSSIIFEIIYRRKPYIMFIPDANDPSIKENYIPVYFDIINGLKNNSIPFENKYFEVDDVVDKIIYYIDNNFELENSLKDFYDSFELNSTNNTQKFVNYLVNLK